MARLFARMQNLYGHKWSSLYPDTETTQVAMADWQDQLVGITLQEVADGFHRLAQRNDKWPPGAAEFRELCRPHREPYEREAFQGNALPLKPASREFAMDQIAKLKKQTRENESCES